MLKRNDINATQTPELKKELEISVDQVHVWVISGSKRQRHDPTSLQLLSADEVTRARRFKSEDHAAQWAFFHACLREILGAYTGQAPEQLRFQLGAHDKPALQEPSPPPLYFNLSHSGELALLALTRRAPIGVDIELQRELNDRDALVARFFSDAEQA
ncbi:MAG: 4'-phosphopantetheinyl transferase superfamily protein, partial [Lysobacterales bacterium]